ncbi:MAG TPA: FAD-linked oxidase C-terminal domain-containing protein [Pyrinomonadaceae bacterium]|nr:FAD-linked oxidase C-terminal domain-containing protein [Pyrinomonadaceae bacterium]
MLVKSEQDAIQSFLADASNLAGGKAARVLLPESSEEAAEALARASVERTPVTVAGAGTGVVGGRVPFGGAVLSTERLNSMGEFVREGGGGGRATVGAGVVLADFQREARARGLLYPPDPTESSCYMGGTVATNASGARTFKYGPTRNYVRRLKVALATGDVIDVRRGEIRADGEGRLRVPLGGGRQIDARLPTFAMPSTRKHAAGYYVEKGMDLLDLFVGSEGTLGVVTEAEVSLLPQPEGVLAGVVFFREEESLLAFVRDARGRSLRARASARESDTESAGLDARALEYFDAESLSFLRERYPLVPARAAGAVFFEQETTEENEEPLMNQWLELVEGHGALADESWFGTNEHDRAEMRAFRHALPVMVNEWLSRHGQRKVSTDMAVPDAAFPEMLRFYKDTLRASRLSYVIFGHIGDNHVHVNMLPRDDIEQLAARETYARFVERAVSLGGTISAEHGVGKIKRDYLRALYGERALREMAELKRAFDPACVLGRGNIFAEELLRAEARP